MAQATAQPIVFAGTGRRVAALLLDLILLAFVIGVARSELSVPPYVIVPLVFLYVAGMPLSPLLGTLGKWICRIRLCDRQGRRLSWRASAVRAGATMCWFGLPFFFDDIASLSGLASASLSSIWWLVFPLAWAPTSFLPRRESLFDLLAGSLVVRYGADAESVARAEPVQKPGILNVAGTALVFLGGGAVFSILMGVQADTNRRARIGYAIEQVAPLREKIEAFNEREKRWPTAAELGIPESTPYRDGGGYRLQKDGVIVITFSVLPELKGRSITFRPTRTADGEIRWKCSADAGIKPGYLPGACR